MTKANRFRAVAAGALAATLLLAGGGFAAAQSTSVIVGPGPGAQDRGVPPTFQQYPLWQRIFGVGGAVFPGYVAPPTTNGRTSISLLTGGGEGKLVFAAGTADTICQTEQAPTITILDAPSNVSLAVDYGNFVVHRVQAGSSRCLGRVIQGARVFVSGRLPRSGATARLRVAYPTVGRAGRTYTQVVSIPAR
ncbi:hypothetical protein [Ancylobacter pratisalsi]|uniref:DUF4402 domain-containing protein n=1 Tax=Ancylobacter pratisalsi TaxID=1745854 RepID=A0A6P1YM34_9HYPH|nr:hypothetical protein [Ancylobacter pratisalsi]QIB33746.1 hypothetical protein G3A50_08540 [Ancylobacter pratisalsi]